MKTEQQWNDAGWCFRNAEVLRQTNMPTAADVWQKRGEELIAQMVPSPVANMFEELLNTNSGRKWR